MTPNGIFVTGGSGFVGRRLLPMLLAQGRTVVALARPGSRLPDTALTSPASLAVVKGDLLAPETYRDALRACRVVIHLAAATGRAPASAHDRVNVEGTRVLLEACRDAKVSRVLFVSSIAATFPAEARYPYADAKREAERLVSGSGVPFTIVRPTMILGPRAPILSSLGVLARLPVMVFPGDGRTRVQPVHVDDVARQIVDIVQADAFAGETIELGGPDTITIEELVQQIRRATGRATGRVIHLPIGLLAWPLRAAEAAGLGRMLPLTAAQLSSFRYDGVARAGTGSRSTPPLIGIAEMVGAASLSATSMAAPIPSASASAFVAECRVFTRYLLSCEPDAYVQSKYGQALASLPALAPVSRFDQALLRFAGLGSFAARLADSYAALFQQGSALRKRLVLLLAILETRPPFSTRIDDAPGSAGGAVVRLVGHGVTGAIALLAGLLVFVPMRLALGGIPKRTR